MMAFRRFVATVGLIAGPLVVVAPAWAQASNDMAVWLRRNCLDKGTGDHPLIGKEFEACLRKRIENLPALDKSKRELFGEKYNPARYVDCRLRPNGRADAACDIYILRRREWPEYWPEDAKLIKWPQAPKESVYRRGLTPRQYWEALCKAEAGEFIYKAMKNVKGFLLIRPRGQESDQAMQDKYVLEDAYGLHEFEFGDDAPRPGRRIFRLDERNYLFVESGIPRSSLGTVWIRHTLDAERLRALLRSPPKRWDESDFTSTTEAAKAQSRYGVTWRGIRRVQDIELGISGGELAVIDLSSGEILALRRGFALDGYAARGIKDRYSWMGSWGCPVMARESKTLRDFVSRVLEPMQVAQ